MKFVKGIAIGAVALGLAACDQSAYGGGGINKQTVGTVGGAEGFVSPLAQIGLDAQAGGSAILYYKYFHDPLILD